MNEYNLFFNSMTMRGVVISLFLIIVFFLLGLWGGVFYQAKVTGTQPTLQTTSQPSIVKDLSSKVVPSIAAYGTISKIDGKMITLTYQSDSVTMKIADDAKIYSFTSTSTTGAPSSSKQIAFKDLSVGQSVSVNLHVMPNGSLEGFSVIVVPISPK